MKRLLVLFLLPALFLPAGAQAILPTVVPEPVSFEISSTDYVPLEKVSVACPDKAAAPWAEAHLREWYGDLAPKVVRARSEAFLGEEGAYELAIGRETVSVRAGSLQGVRYALYTLRQLAIPARGTLKVEGWIAPVSVYPGEMEQEALAGAVLRVLSGEEAAHIYAGRPVWTGFDWD